MRVLNVLIACEESQAVTKEFRALGHIAFSCDIEPCSGGHSEWHIQGDALPLLNGNCDFVTQDGVDYKIRGKWDLIIAFPPCTDLAVSGARHFERKRADGSQQRSIDFFMKFVNADCEHIAIENPIGIMSKLYRKPNQIIHPWMFSEEENIPKSTCLWLKGLPLLIPIITDRPEIEYFEWTDKNGKKKRQAKWYMDALKLSPAERRKARSKTFKGIAKNMAVQWNGYLQEVYNGNNSRNTF